MVYAARGFRWYVLMIGLTLLGSSVSDARATISPVATSPESRNQRLLIISGGYNQLERQLAAQAGQLGLQVQSEDGVASQPQSELAATRQVGAILTLVSPDRVNLYVLARGEQPAYQSSMQRQPDDGEGFAVRVIEQLRGRLVALGGPGERPERSTAERLEPPPSTAGRAHDPGRPARDAKGTTASVLPALQLALGLSSTRTRGGLGRVPQASIGLRVGPLQHWSFSLDALFPLAGQELSESEGTAEVRPTVLALQLGLQLYAQGAFELEAGGGAGLLMLDVSAQSQAPFSADDDQLLAGLYFLQGSSAVSLNPWLRLRATLRAGTTAPRPVLRFDGRQVASFGRGFASAALGIEFGIPLAGASRAP